MEPNIKKYLIPCKDIERYNLVKATLNNTHYHKVEMNSSPLTSRERSISPLGEIDLNGTYDYIIECTDEYANHLRNLGIGVISDRHCNTTTPYSFALTPALYEPSGFINMSVYVPRYRTKTPAEIDAELAEDIDEPISGIDINDFF